MGPPAEPPFYGEPAEFPTEERCGRRWTIVAGQNGVLNASNARQSPVTNWRHRRGGALGFIFAMQGGAARRLWNVSGWISRATGFVRP